MRTQIIIGCMLLGALSVGAQEKPVKIGRAHV